MIQLYKYLPGFVIILTFPSVSQWLDLPIGNTTIWWGTNAATLLAFYQYKKYCQQEERKLPVPIKCFLIWVTISGIYGYFMADYYWDAKLLVNNLMIYLMGISVAFFSEPDNIAKISKKWCSFILVAFWFLLPFMQLEAPGKLLVPFSFFILFWPYYPMKWRCIVLLFTVAVFIYGTLGARSTFVRFTIAIFFSFLIYFKNLISYTVINNISRLFIAAPFILLILGVTAVFNIWNLEQYLGSEEILVSGSYSGGTNDTYEENIKADTRTFIYEEVINSAITNNYVIQGRSLARGYDSPFFSWMTDMYREGSQYHHGERAESEVSILNIFTYMGLIGVLLYALIFIGAIRSVFSNSNSKIMNILALYVAFRWGFAWVEDFTRFDLNNLFLWVLIAMCYSSKFLNMTDEEIEKWVSNLFN